MNFGTIIANEIAKPEMTNLIGKFIDLLFGAIHNYGLTVVVFTLLLKILLSPLDIWQKVATRKQSRSMARLQPQMEKLQRQYANNPDMLRIKQAELYRKEKVTSSMLASCLPMIVTLVVFFVVFEGFNAMVRYQNELIVYEMAEGYKSTMTTAEVKALYDSVITNQYKFLWIDNIFMADSWANVIPTFNELGGKGMGQIGVDVEKLGLTKDLYEAMFKPAMDVYNKSSFWNIAKWNGYMVLPILSIVTSVLSTKFMQYSTPQPTGTKEQQKQAQMSQKIMLIMMPIMIGVFSLFYSSAFSLYLFISNLISTIFNLIFNLVSKKKDMEDNEKRLENTYI